MIEYEGKTVFRVESLEEDMSQMIPDGMNTSDAEPFNRTTK